MGNYKNEKEFQTAYIKYLKENGYRVYKLPDIGYTLKPFDIIAIKPGEIQTIELKYGDVNTYDKIYKKLRPNQVGGLLNTQEHGCNALIVGWDKGDKQIYTYKFKYREYEGVL